ncbi:MAG: DUF1016 N-terminal domain-containing protein [Thermodesulfobacteriota bacterium]
MTKAIKKEPYSTLITDLASLIEQGRKVAVQYVNTALVSTYWLMGRRIVEYEQKGKERAEYGEALLKKLSIDLTHRFGKGWGLTNLKTFRQFYLTYSGVIQKSHTVCDQSISALTDEKSHTVCGELQPVPQTGHEISETLVRELPLSWSNYRLLIRLDEPFKREFYEAECIRI